MKCVISVPSCLLLIAGLIFGCGPRPNKDGNSSNGSDDKKGPKRKKAVPVEVTALSRGPIEETLKLSTTLEAEAQVKVFSRSANRVTELLAEEGDRVEKGQVLLRMENELQRIAFAKATNNLAKARKEYDRQKPLYDQELISEQAFSDLQFELRQFELSLEDTQRELAYTEVRAPIAGTITRRLVNLGDHLTINQQVFEIIDFHSIVARVYHPEKYLTRLSVGQPARVQSTALGNQTFSAHVKRIAPVVEDRSGTVKITLGFNQVDQLRPGMHVDTEIVLATVTNALLIPKRALVYDGDQTYVYRLQPDRKVERLLVEAQMTDKLNLTPISGFAEGDQIVVAGQTGLKDGSRVRLPEDPEPEDPKPVKEAAALDSP